MVGVDEFSFGALGLFSGAFAVSFRECTPRGKKKSDSFSFKELLDAKFDVPHLFGHKQTQTFFRFVYNSCIKLCKKQRQKAVELV